MNIGEVGTFGHRLGQAGIPLLPLLSLFVPTVLVVVVRRKKSSGVD